MSHTWRNGDGRKRPMKIGRCGPTGKVRYESHDAAFDGAYRLLEAKPQVKELRAYRCNLCAGWHLTSKPKTIPK